MNTVPRAVSEIIRSKDLDDDEPKKRSREEWRKAKELEEARKAGTAPAAVDESGKDINPHIPQYIASAPWYIGSQGPTLKHQRPQEEKEKSFARIEDYYVRGLKGSTATRYRKGACENCGAITHKRKDCLERPRKVGAKFSGEDIVPDEMILPKMSMDYDGKRDRWNGFEPDMYKFVIDEHLKIEEAKRALKEEKLKEDLISVENKGTETVESDSDPEEDEKYADHIDMPGTKVDSKQRITVRNLRIREDTAKYLRNLDIDSAYYDPKTRSMRDNPYKTTGKSPDELQYAGENFVRYTGDTQNIARAQLFAWQAYDKGVDVHLQAEPTKAELLHKEYNIKKDEHKEGVRQDIVEKYGGDEHLKMPPKELIYAQTENYTEYSRQGLVIKGHAKPVIRSIYEEDVYINSHTSVWGSFWKNGKWGYKCCQSFIRNSYCTGDTGKQALADANHTALLLHNDNGHAKDGINEDNDDSITEQRNANNKTLDGNTLDGNYYTKSLLEQHKEKKDAQHRENKRKKRKHDTSDNSSDEEECAGEDKLEKACKDEERNMREAERLLKMDERKRPYNSMYDVKAPTEEELEAYQLKRKREDDPMAAFFGN